MELRGPGSEKQRLACHLTDPVHVAARQERERPDPAPRLSREAVEVRDLAVYDQAFGAS